MQVSHAILYNNVGFDPIDFVQNIKFVVGQLQHWSPKTWPSLDPKTLTSLLMEVAAAADDELFGPTSERGNDEQWTANGDAATCCKWVDFPPEFFPSSNRLLRFPSDLEIVSIFLLFIEFYVLVVGSSKMVHGSSFFVRGISVFSMPV